MIAVLGMRVRRSACPLRIVPTPAWTEHETSQGTRRAGQERRGTWLSFCNRQIRRRMDLFYLASDAFMKHKQPPDGCTAKNREFERGSLDRVGVRECVWMKASLNSCSRTLLSLSLSIP